MAALGNQVEIARLLIEHGGDVNAGKPGGFTPLTKAVWKDSAAVVKLLLEAGADVTSQDDDGKTALMVARERGSKASVRLLEGRLWSVP